MHYCQSCDGPVALEPRDGHAVCPECGRAGEAAALGPLFVVTGASCSGKTAALAPLARRLSGRCVTLDADLLMDSAAALSGRQPVNWPAFRDAWLAIAHGVAQSGMPTVLRNPRRHRSSHRRPDRPSPHRHPADAVGTGRLRRMRG